MLQEIASNQSCQFQFCRLRKRLATTRERPNLLQRDERIRSTPLTSPSGASVMSLIRFQQVSARWPLILPGWLRQD